MGTLHSQVVAGDEDQFQQAQSQSHLDPPLKQPQYGLTFDISVAYSSGYGDECLLGCCAVLSGRSLPTFQSDRLDDGATKYLWYVNKLLPDYMAQQFRSEPPSNYTFADVVNLGCTAVWNCRWVSTHCLHLEILPHDFTRRYNLEDQRQHLQHRENLTSHTDDMYFVH
jgi:hypothetical protein